MHRSLRVLVGPPSVIGDDVAAVSRAVLGPPIRALAGREVIAVDATTNRFGAASAHRASPQPLHLHVVRLAPLRNRFCRHHPSAQPTQAAGTDAVSVAGAQVSPMAVTMEPTSTLQDEAGHTGWGHESFTALQAAARADGEQSSS